ncbi:MAG: acylphosphatase [bacterium]|nr:acylphosphatase [bacterium]
MVRRTIHYSGTVQGVGFRYAVHRQVQGTEVTGYVRNLPDGRVELVMEGAADRLDELDGAIQQDMLEYIRSTASAVSPATGEYPTFSIAL